MLTYATVDTADGPFTVIERDDGAVVAAGWSAGPEALVARAGWQGADAGRGACDSAAAVRAYYAGDPRPVEVYPLALHASDFRSAVWDELRRIPAGDVRTYGEVAAAVGNAAASRAVGAACGANVAALFVPCHRVSGANGALTGFAWGVDIKRSLLERERAWRSRRAGSA